MDLPKKVKNQLEKAINRKAQGSAMEKEGKAISKDAGEEILPIMSVYGIKKYEIDGVGRAIHKSTIRSTLNKGKLEEVLLKEKMTMKKIQKVIDAASTTRELDYVEFRKA